MMNLIYLYILEIFLTQTIIHFNTKEPGILGLSLCNQLWLTSLTWSALVTTNLGAVIQSVLFQHTISQLIIRNLECQEMKVVVAPICSTVLIISISISLLFQPKLIILDNHHSILPQNQPQKKKNSSSKNKFLICKKIG